MHTKKKNSFFLFYTPIFIKNLNQFIYFIHLFIKIFIILPFFIILSLTAPLSHRPNTLSQTQHTKESPVPVACELCCFRWRPILAVRSGSVGSNQSSYAPFSTEDPGPSTPFLLLIFLLLIFFISCLVGEKVVEKSRNRRKNDQLHSNF